MLEQLLRELKNFFVTKNGYHTGTFTVSSSGVVGVDILENQFFLIKGSVFNNGLYKNTANDGTIYKGLQSLSAETFNGEIWTLAIPPEIIDLATEINTWTASNPVNAYQSENFGGYSYVKMDGDGWKPAFATRLKPWRKI